MIQFVINLIEDIILIYFISNYTRIKEKQAFQISLTLVCFIETCILDLFVNYSFLLPILIFFSLLFGIKYYNKILHLNDIISCLLGIAFIIGSDILSLVIIGAVSNLSIDQISQNSYYFIISILLSKLLFFIIVKSTLFLTSNAKKILNAKDWWILFPIWIIIFFIMYTLGESLVFNKLDYKTIYLILILVLLLTVFFLILLYQIQKENELKRINDLNNQRNYYANKNMEMINKLHNEITVIEHSTVYVLMHIKSLIYNKNFNELDEFLDKNIKKSRKYESIINTDNPYFDHEINKSLHSLLIQGGNVKTSIFIKPNQIQIEKKHLDLFVRIIEYLFSISLPDKVFNIEIYQKSTLYIVLSISFFKKDTSLIKIPNDILKLIHLTQSQYNISTLDNITTFKLIVELSEE